MEQRASKTGPDLPVRPEEEAPEDPCCFRVGKTPVRVTYGGKDTLAQVLTAYFTAQKAEP